VSRRLLISLAATVSLLLTSCGGGTDPLAGDSAGDEPSGDTIAVGSADFSESILLGQMYSQALSAKDVKVEEKLNIGSREVYIPAVEDGSIDLMPEYTGNLLLYFDPESVEADSADVFAALQEKVPSGLTVLEKSEAVDEDAVVVTRETAEQYDLESIEDLAAIDDQLVIGGSPEFRERKAGLKGLEEVYGLEFKEFKSLDVAGPLTVEALKSGDVDVSQLFTTQSAISQNDFVVLDDPEHIHVAQNVVPLIRESKASDTVVSVLNEISAKLDTETLMELVARIDVDKENPDAVAKDWLTDNGLL